MIEYIQGDLITRGAGFVIIQVGGIGYRLYVSSMTLGGLPSSKGEVTLYTYLYIREDEISLYGFAAPEEKELFTTLLLVSGIGPKLALSVLSRLRVSEFKRAVILGDTVSLVSIPGVGKKTAERIILELKDKVGKQELEESLIPGDGQGLTDLRSQAISALQALGYSLAEAQRAVPAQITAESKVTVEDLIRRALKAMVKY